MASLTCDGGYDSEHVLNGTGLLILPNHCSLRVGDRILLHSPIYSSFKALPFSIQHTDKTVYEDILKELGTDQRKPKTNSLKTMVSLEKLHVLAHEQVALTNEIKAIPSFVNGSKLGIDVT